MKRNHHHDMNSQVTLNPYNWTADVCRSIRKRAPNCEYPNLLYSSTAARNASLGFLEYVFGSSSGSLTKNYEPFRRWPNIQVI